MAKINKALDLNKLWEAHREGRLLKNQLRFPVFGSRKFDGNYVVIEVSANKLIFTTSGGLHYTHTDKAADIFRFAVDGFYLAERIYDKGLLGQRTKCNLTGPKKDQKSTRHNYKVFDYIDTDSYNKGVASTPYHRRIVSLYASGIPTACIYEPIILETMLELNNYLAQTVELGYEGVMLMQADWLWRDTKRRGVDFCKYKKRPTADLLCIGTELGDGKYKGMIGSLILKDSEGRVVKVGSGLTDGMRVLCPSSLTGKIIEIEYEQIIDTYIQPTFIQVRDDKKESD